MSHETAHQRRTRLIELYLAANYAQQRTKLSTRDMWENGEGFADAVIAATPQKPEEQVSELLRLCLEIRYLPACELLPKNWSERFDKIFEELQG